MSNNNNTNDHDEREGRVLELYDQGKNTREIAKEENVSWGYWLYPKKGSSKPWNCNNNG
jgi:hypothetical protein